MARPRLTESTRAAVLDALRAGRRPSEVAEQFGLSRAAVSYWQRQVHVEPPAPAPAPAQPEQPEVAEPEQGAEPEAEARGRVAAMSDEALEAAARSDRAWLEHFRANERIPVSERVRAAIALERISHGAAEQDWRPPEDAELWAEALTELLLAQPEQVQASVRTALTP